MSHANPTSLCLGQNGLLGGRNYAVAGRVVLSVEIDGETYFWNEFNLVNDSGQSATLVFEEGENSPEWRLFTLFDPPRPMTAAEAASKRVGDTVNLTGYPAKVTLVDESRVVHLEGRAPEGVEVGDVANYFNIEAGNQMWVVSWTGDEVECFKGLDLPGDQVARAFGFAPTDAGSSGVSLALGMNRIDSGLGGSSASSAVGKVIVGLIAAVSLAIIGFTIYQTIYQNVLRSRATRAATKAPTPAVLAVVGATGRLKGESFRVAGIATLEIRATDSVHDWHEYHLNTSAGTSTVLVQRLDPKSGDWHQLRPVAADSQLTAFRAAALRIGERVQIDGVGARVTEIFQGKLTGAAGAVRPEFGSAPEFFGFRAAAGTNHFLARWTATTVEFLRASTIPEKEARAALSP